MLDWQHRQTKYSEEFIADGLHVSYLVYRDTAEPEWTAHMLWGDPQNPEDKPIDRELYEDYEEAIAVCESYEARARKSYDVLIQEEEN